MQWSVTVSNCSLTTVFCFMILQQTIDNHYSAARFTIITLLVSIVIFACMGFASTGVHIAALVLLVFSAPGIYVHISYAVSNFDQEFEISKEHIIIKTPQQLRSYATSDIVKIVLYKPASLDFKSGRRALGIEYYSFACLKTKSGEEIIITCLVIPQVEKALSEMGLKWERKKGLAFLERKN